MNLNIYNTTDYENKCDWTIGQNKPNSNPIKPNLQKAKMNVNSIITKDYRKKDAFIVRINKPNFRNGQNECNLKYNKGLWQFSDRDYEKTKPNKPNFKRCTSRHPLLIWVPGVFAASHQVYFVSSLIKRWTRRFTWTRHLQKTLKN